MKLSKPRIAPLPESQWSAEQRPAFEAAKNGKSGISDAVVFNVLGTLGNHPEAAKKFNVWAFHVMGDSSTLGKREREILILRIGWLCQAEYEWAQHAVIGRKCGLTDVEIERIKEGPDAKGWNELDSLLLRATDELHKDACIADATWNGLAKHYNTHQLMDVVFAVGQYNLVSMALNSFGVQLDQGLKGF